MIAHSKAIFKGYLSSLITKINLKWFRSYMQKKLKIGNKPILPLGKKNGCHFWRYADAQPVNLFLFTFRWLKREFNALSYELNQTSVVEFV